MKSKQLLLSTAFLGLFCLVLEASDNNWILKKCDGYHLLYMSNDMNNIEEYNKLIENGITSVNAFFNSTFNEEFVIMIHPDRHSLDSTWRKDWNMPDFKSACWMVASGVASRLDLLSPGIWDIESCEHTYSDIIKTQQLITHELVHVFHGQQNASPDFSEVSGIDWFVEGLATYASGQCDSVRIEEIKRAISDNEIPKSLNDFFSGKLKYGLSGSVVMYIDSEYGRNKLKELLHISRITDLLNSLSTTGPELLDGWKKYIQKL